VRARLPRRSKTKAGFIALQLRFGSANHFLIKVSHLRARWLEKFPVPETKPVIETGRGCHFLGLQALK
jgi:hypothetical protein